MPIVAKSGSGAVDFAITQPTTPVAASGGTITFTVVFDPSTGGARPATLSISNNDSNENPYNFDIVGIGNPVPTPTPTRTPTPTPTPTPTSVVSRVEGDVVDADGGPNGDGLILANDVSVIRQFALGNRVPDNQSQFDRPT